jgi:hypothetical protein
VASPKVNTTLLLRKRGAGELVDRPVRAPAPFTSSSCKRSAGR